MQLLGKTYFNFISFSQLDFWDVKKNRNYISSKSKYNLVKLNTFLKQVKRVHLLSPNNDYRLLGIKSYGLGVFHRETKKGRDIKATQMWELKEGDFVYSRLGASGGSFGLINKEFDNYFVSNEFPTFIIDKEKVNSDFLYLVLTSPRFYEKLKDLSTGSALKRIHEDNFLNLEIPLPPLSIQNKIAEESHVKRKEAKALEEQVLNTDDRIRNFLLKELGIEKRNSINKYNGLKTIKYSILSKWALSHSIKIENFSFKNCPYNLVRMKELIKTFSGGKTPSKERNDFWNGSIPWASPKDFTGLSLLNTEDKITTDALKEAGMRILPKGTILSVFRSGILRHSFPTVITEIETTINQDLKAYHLNERIINKYYYLQFVNILKDYILLNASKTSVTVESINTEDFLELLIPVPNIEIQNKLINEINSLRTEKHNDLFEIENIKKTLNKEFEKEIFG